MGRGRQCLQTFRAPPVPSRAVPCRPVPVHVASVAATERRRVASVDATERAMALGPMALGPMALGPMALGPKALGPKALGP